MSAMNKSVFEKVFEQISDPWDWAAGGVGAACGAGITIAMGGSDLGTSTLTGFTAGIAGRKALAASLQRRRLKKRANGLKTVLQSRAPQIPQLQELVDELDLEISLWENRATSNDDFAKQIDQLNNKCRNIALKPRQIKIKLPSSNE